jgi:DNA topoisomerase 2-associated protein PAT1
MRKHEKELIAKIQISQLVSDDPFSDDFYFQMKELAKKEMENGESATPLGIKPANKKKGTKWQISAGQLIHVKASTTVSNQMQQQMKRLIESRRAQKPREGTRKLLLFVYQ